MQTSKPQHADLLIIDDILPCDFSPFRSLEYGHYLSFFDSVLLSLEGWHLWISNDSFEAMTEHSPLAAARPGRVLRFEEGMDIAARLAYVTFLGNARRLLPFFRSRSLPFILQLYPGGGFEVNQPATDAALREVLLSDLCRGVIVTQTITRDYIQDKIGIDPAKVTMVFGGVFDSRVRFDLSRDKLFYPSQKETLDLCFVAHKYAGDLSSKGYDQFAAIALALAPGMPHLRFHVVGDYRSQDVPLGAAADRFTFYGPQPSGFFAGFYPRMDAIISINKPFVLAPGAFDGFPTGSCIEAGFRGVLNCLNDPLDLNPTFTHGQDIILLDHDPRRSIAMLRDLLADPPRLYEVAYANWRKFHEVFDVDAQLWARSRLIAAELARQPRLISFMPTGAVQLDAAPLREAVAVQDQMMRLGAAEARAAAAEAELVSVAAQDQMMRLGAAEARAAAAEAELAAVAAQDQMMRLGAAEARAAAAEAELAAVRASLSWRLTRPLRAALGDRRARQSAKRVRQTGLFDDEYYRRCNPDVAGSGMDGALHFVLFGWQEGRKPSAGFDPAFYLDQNPDVRAAGINPLFHYVQYGRAEGRQPLPA